MKILFSPIGTTDPISKNNYKDGSMLHIARVYKPDKIILYMSKEMLELQDKDDRFRYCIRELDKLNSTHTEIEIIERANLTKVNEFDFFYEDFKNILDSYTKNLTSEDELLINISSGTPQMKSGLAVLQTMLGYERCRLIQVVTPEGRSNTHKHGDCDIDLLWEYCEDNVENFENRCREVVCPSLSTIKMEEILKKHVLAYDYSAALTIAEELPDKITGSYIHLLRYAKARLQLNEIEVDNLKSEYNECDFLPIKKTEQRKVVEYALALEIKRQRGECADFLRAITPLLVELFNNVLKNCFRCDLKDYTETVNGAFRWKDIDVNEELNKLISKDDWKTHYRKKPVSSYHLYIIMKNIPKTDKQMVNAFEIAEKLKEVEQKIRNKAAHQMVSVTENKIQDITNMTSDGIMKKIRELFTYSDINIPKQGGWNSYELMNDSIISKISSRR